MVSDSRPLAARLRPRSITDFVGQSHLMDPGKPLAQSLAERNFRSTLFWGPPGVGKTTLSHLIADELGIGFVSLSAVDSGVKTLREVLHRARDSLLPPILFIDEIHRFNKGQQDALLHGVEEGVVVLIGATTENPAFEVNRALLSRLQVLRLESLSEADLHCLLKRALESEDGYGGLIEVSPEAGSILVRAADGDGRRLYNLLEASKALLPGTTGNASAQKIDQSLVSQALSEQVLAFDKGGDHFYDQISALHKSVRGSDPDAALYWCTRMLESGCDPAYLGRRIVRMAIEDIGLADPRGLRLALDGCETWERLGSPEGELALAQAVIYLACAAKSNAVYKAYGHMQKVVAEAGSVPVPVHLRNAPTQLARDAGHGKDYAYPHDAAGGFIAGVQYAPDGVAVAGAYQPVDRGLEIKLREKLARLAQENEAAGKRDFGDSSQYPSADPS